jgi:hypothetical protein
MTRPAAQGTLVSQPIAGGGPQTGVTAQRGSDSHGPSGGDPADAEKPTAQTHDESQEVFGGGPLGDPLLQLSADVLDDLERVRIANENRLRQLTRSEADGDGEVRGFGLSEEDPEVARLAALVDLLRKAEADAATNLGRHMRTHPLGPWVKAQRMVGDKQAARLLAAIGDPYIRPEITREDDTVEPPRVRKIRELYALCGYSPGQVKRKGVRARWSHAAKMRAHLIAKKTVMGLAAPCERPEGSEWAKHVEGCKCGPYRVLYDQARQHYAGRDTTPKHRENMAHRVVAKRLLRDLWEEARRLHQES